MAICWWLLFEAAAFIVACLAWGLAIARRAAEPGAMLATR